MPKIQMEKANIRQNVKLYEDALKRHGQYMMWHRSLVCYCIDDMGRADPKCRECYGRGFDYEPVNSIRRVDEGMGNGSNIILTKGNIKSINRLFGSNNQNIDYENFAQNAISLTLIMKSSKYWYCDYIENLKVSFTGSGTYEGRGIIRVPIVGYSTIYGNFIGKIVEITSVINKTKNNEKMNVVSFWENLILTDSNVDLTDEIDIICKYVKPLKMLISGISQKKKYEASYVTPEADAQLTVPGFYYMGTGDIITQLKAEQRTSIVGKGSGSFHILPFFHVKSIISIKDEIGYITDASIVRNNEIKWGSRIPDNFSITLTYNPSYTVMQDLPQMRYAEEKVFPRKVMLKQFDMLSRGNKRPSGRFLNQGDLIY